MKPTRRIRGRALQEQRATFLRMHPLCAQCQRQGRVAEAVEVDHVVPLFKGGADTDANKQGLCVQHHAEKTARDMGYAYRPKVRIGVDGYPEDG